MEGGRGGREEVERAGEELFLPAASITFRLVPRVSWSSNPLSMPMCSGALGLVLYADCDALCRLLYTPVDDEVTGGCS